jgi:hypothetical protein
VSLVPGARLGPYQILAPLGAGGMGEVYRAHDSRLGRDVAVKVLPAHLAATPEVRARFEREARTISRLNHPHICTLFDVGHQDGIDYLVMELLEGETLAHRLEKGALPVAEVLTLGRQIAEALDRAHRAGVVHRDLKPGNVMLTKSGAKLMDFGLARAQASGPVAGALTQSPTAAQPLTAEGTIVGTFQYMAPEQLEGKEADARSDLWGLGCVLYEMATGARAFAGGTQASLISAIMRDTPRSMGELQPVTPPALERIVSRCLAKDPDDRFQNASDLAFALEGLVAHSFRPTPAIETVAKPGRLRWRLMSALGVVVIVIPAASYFLVRIGVLGSGTPALTYAQKTFGRQAIFQARFAPDGQAIVFSAAKEGNTPELFIIRPDDPEPRPLGVPGLHLLSVSSRGELAVLAGARYLGHHRLFKGTLARMPIAGGAPRPMLEDVRDADWSPDGSGLAIIRERGGRDRLEYPIGKVLFESAGYLSDLRFSPKGDRLAFMEHPWRYDDRGTVNVVDLSGKAKVLTGVFWGEEGLAWSVGGQEVLFTAFLTGSSSNVYAVDLGGRQHAVMSGPGQLTILDSGPKGRWLVSRDEIPSGLTVKAPGETAERDLSWLDSASGPVLSGDGRTLLFTDQSEMAGNNYNACVRGTDGSPIIRLGEGYGDDLSRDGAAVLAHVPSDKPRLMSYPTGAGEPERLDRGQLAKITSAQWLSDRRHVLVSGAEPGKAPRCYFLDAPGGALRPVTPEGTLAGLVAPDGLTMLARTSSEWMLYRLEGGGGRPIGSLSLEDNLIRWSPDGRSVFAYRGAQIPLRVDRIDIATGRRTAFAELSPAERAGLVSFLDVSLADDLESYAYVYQRYISTLYLAEGAR